MQSKMSILFHAKRAEITTVGLVPIYLRITIDGKPIVKESLHVGHPFFKYVKSGYEGVQIYKDWGDGKGFVKFDKAINPTYTDNSALPAAGVAVSWKYKFIYLYKEAEVGTPSEIVEVLVTGMQCLDMRYEFCVG